MFIPITPHEPEGLTSTLSAVGSAFAGMYFGLVLRNFRTWQARLAQWTVAAGVLVLSGVTIALATEVPINKKLYTISYMLLTSGMAGGVLSFIYLVADVVGGRLLHGALFPLACIGMNAIIIYVGDSVFWRMTTFVFYEDPSQNLYDEFKGAVVGLLPPEDANYGQILWAVIDALLWTVVAVILWWRKIFFKV
jgi:heparan-alpha-glucosaminide N-acetyltransferase